MALTQVNQAEQLSAFANLAERLEPIGELRNHIAHGHMYCRYEAKSQRGSVTLLKAADLDTGFLPGSKHVEFEELVKGLTALSELIEGFQTLLFVYKHVVRQKSPELEAEAIESQTPGMLCVSQGRWEAPAC